MASGSCNRDEYESQLFGFSQNDFFEFAKTCIFDAINDTLVNCQNSVMKRIPEEDKPAFVEGLKQLGDVFMQTAEQGPVLRLKRQLSPFFTIPPHVLLPEDFVHRNPSSEEQVKKLEQELEELSQRWKRVAIKKQLLQSELKKGSDLLKKAELIKSTLLKLSVDSASSADENASKSEVLETVDLLLQEHSKAANLGALRKKGLKMELLKMYEN